MFRHLLILIILPFILGFVSARAEVTFILDNEITLPDSFYINGNTTFEFTDLDKDNFEEIIVENQSIIASYSLKDNRTIDYFVKEIDTLLKKYTWGYIDDDSLLDFIRVAVINSDTFIYVFSTQYLSSENYQASGETQIYEASGFDWCYDERVEYINRLFLEDTDYDENMELYIRLQLYTYTSSISYMQCALMWQIRNLVNFKYIPGEDSAIAIDQLPVDSKQQYYIYDDNNLITVNTDNGLYYCYYDSHVPNPQALRWSTVRTCDDSDLIMSDSINCIYSCEIPFPRGAGEKGALLQKYCIGDVLTSSPRYEIIGLVYQYSWSDIYQYNMFPSYYDSSWHLVCYDLSSPDSLTEIWNNVLPDHPDIDLIFSDTAYINRFFTFGGHRFNLHNSENGEILDSSNIINYGNGRILDYRAIETEDNQKMAILIDSSDLKFYSIAVLTSVDNHAENLLPLSFYLKQPYPNPYNARLSIPIDIARKSNLKVGIYNVLGQHIEQIFDDHVLPGELIISWDSGKQPSGIYFIRAQTDLESQTVKAVLLK